MNVALKFPIIALVAWMIFSLVGGSSTPELLVKWGLFLVTAALAYGWWKSRGSGKPVMPDMKEMPAAEKAWLKETRKRWVKDLDNVGFVRWHATKNKSLPDQAEAPRLLSCRLIPLGLELGIEIIAGHQTQADWLGKSEHLSSAWDIPVEIVRGQNPRHVIAVIQFHDPLNDARDVEEVKGDFQDWGVRDA